MSENSMVHSLSDMAEVEILTQNGPNAITAKYRGKVCTAIRNPFNGLLYVDDVYGVIRRDEDAEE